MRGKSLALVACLAAGTGCHLYRNAARILIHEPALYFDEKHLSKQLHKDARHAWAEVCRQYPKRTFTDDFVDGFLDGYVDYLDNGGTAQIPAVPPFKYRRAKFRNPEGWERTRQYFLGFKYGMDVAIDTGCRTFLTIPVVLPEPAPPGEPNITILPSPPDTSVPPLQFPRPVPPGGMSGPAAPAPADPQKGKETPAPKPLDKDPVPMKPGDKENSVEIPIPVPEPEPRPVAPQPRPVPPPGTVPVPPGATPSTVEPSKVRPLFPISTTPLPDAGSAVRPLFLPDSTTTSGDGHVPIPESPPARPLPINP